MSNSDYDKNIEKLPPDAFDDLERYVKMINQHHLRMSKAFGISDVELTEILDGRRIVSRVEYKPLSQHHRITVFPRLSRKAFGFAGVITVSILLTLCLAVDGFADSIRHSILSIFIRPIATRVETVLYEQNERELSGFLLPSELLTGYSYLKHTKPSGSEMVHVVYANDRGEKIEYYFYPHGAVASYDSEYADMYALSSKNGLLHVLHTDTGNTTVYSQFANAYIQIDFEAGVTDDELTRIVNGLRIME